MVLDPKKRQQILRSIEKRVVKHHINIAGIDYDAWTAGMEARTPELLAGDLQSFETGIRSLLTELKTSHTAFYHSLPTELPPQHTINATLRDVSLNGVHKWMFLDVFQGGPADIAEIRPGDILETVDDAACLPPLAPQFTVGHSNTLTISKRGGAYIERVVVNVPHRKGTKQRPPMVEPKSPVHAMIGPNIGLLTVPYFPGAAGLGFSNALDGAVHDLKQQGCGRLILDLRGNIGGSLGFARLASYMCSGEIAIGHSLTPHRLRSGYSLQDLPAVPMPRTKLGLVFTLARFAFRDKSVILLTQGLGSQPFHNRIVVIVNEWTNSAAEMVAAFAGENRLATIVGNRTRGNVLGASNFQVGCGYWLRLPVFGWNTSKGRSLEGYGVAPDVAVDVSPDGLAAGQDDQLARAIEIVNGL